MLISIDVWIWCLSESCFLHFSLCRQAISDTGWHVQELCCCLRHCPPISAFKPIGLFLSLELPNSTLPSVAIINIFMSHPASYNHDFIKSVVSFLYIYEWLFYQAFVTCIPWTAFFLASNIGILRNSYMRKWYLCHLCGGQIFPFTPSIFDWLWCHDKLILQFYYLNTLISVS